MELSLSHLSLMIELTESEIYRMKSIIDNSSSTEEEVDASGEHSMQLLSLSTALAELYKHKWSDNCNYPSYEDLVSSLKLEN